MKTTRKITINGYLTECEIDYDITNFGIGSYEFWGATGVDNDFGIEINEITSSNDYQNKYIDRYFDSIAEEVALEMEKEGVVENYIYGQEDCSE